MQLLGGKRGGGFKVIFFPYGSPLQISCKNSNKSGENKNRYIYGREPAYICGSRMSLYCVIGLHGFLEISVTATREEREG